MAVPTSAVLFPPPLPSRLYPYFVDRDAHTFHVQTVHGLGREAKLGCREVSRVPRASRRSDEPDKDEQTPGLRASLLWVRRYFGARAAKGALAPPPKVEVHRVTLGPCPCCSQLCS